MSGDFQKRVFDFLDVDKLITLFHFTYKYIDILLFSKHIIIHLLKILSSFLVRYYSRIFTHTHAIKLLTNLFLLDLELSGKGNMMYDLWNLIEIINKIK